MDDDKLLTPAPVDARAFCKRTWWVFLIGGLASVAFGLLAIYDPAVALFVLAMYFAATIMVDGVFNIIGAVQHREKDGWWLMLLIGFLGTLLGIYALLNPPVSMAALIYLVAFMAILLGVLLIAMGRKLGDAIEREWVLYLCGALSILWGALIVFQPAQNALSVVYFIASWAIATGALRIFFALKAKNFADNVTQKIAGPEPG